MVRKCAIKVCSIIHMTPRHPPFSILLDLRFFEARGKDTVIETTTTSFFDTDHEKLDAREGSSVNHASDRLCGIRLKERYKRNFTHCL